MWTRLIFFASDYNCLTAVNFINDKSQEIKKSDMNDKNRNWTIITRIMTKLTNMSKAVECAPVATDGALIFDVKVKFLDWIEEIAWSTAISTDREIADAIDLDNSSDMDSYKSRASA